MNKQIDEMAKVIYDKFGTMVIAKPGAESIATYLTRNGYCHVKELFDEIIQAIEKGRVEADKIVTDSTTILDLRNMLVRTGNIYTANIGMAICDVFRKHTEKNEGE